MVTVAQSATNRRNTHTHVDRTHPLTHLQLQPRWATKRQLSYYKIWNRVFILEVSEGGGGWGGRKPEYSEKLNPRQPAG